MRFPHRADNAGPGWTLRAGATLALALALLAGAGRAGAEPREVGGQAGVLGEWELSASVVERGGDGAQQLVGPLNLRHVGICSADGPEEKTGEIRLRFSESSARVNATLLIDGSECTYSGSLKDDYNGLMRCPGRPAVPLMLWIK
jgi:hypothetical protein